MLQEAKDTEEIIGRVAALDIGKATLTCCVRVPDPDHPGKRLQEVATHATMTRSLLVLADDRLRDLGSLGWSWRQPATTGSRRFPAGSRGFEVWLVNAKTSSTSPVGPRPTS